MFWHSLVKSGISSCPVISVSPSSIEIQLPFLSLRQRLYLPVFFSSDFLSMWLISDEWGVSGSEKCKLQEVSLKKRDICFFFLLLPVMAGDPIPPYTMKLNSGNKVRWEKWYPIRFHVSAGLLTDDKYISILSINFWGLCNLQLCAILQYTCGNMKVLGFKVWSVDGKRK